MSHFPATPTPTPGKLSAEEREMVEAIPLMAALLSHFTSLRDQFHTAHAGCKNPDHERLHRMFRELEVAIDCGLKDSGIHEMLAEAISHARQL